MTRSNIDVPGKPTFVVHHLRAVRPIRFPSWAEVPEGKEHLEVRTFLFQLLRFALGDGHAVGSDQFIYWNARDPSRSLSPDAFVRLGTKDSLFDSWKTWERSTPELAVEVITPDEDDGVAWDEKLTRYHELGVSELLRFDPREPEGRRLRAWDRVENDLVEREVEGDSTPCRTLNLVWVVCSLADAPIAVRLVNASGELVLDARETEAKGRAEEAKGRAEEAKGRLEAEARAKAEATAREAAEMRIRELEEELRRRG